MEEYLKKVKIFNDFFGIYIKGNFDMSEEESAMLMELFSKKQSIENFKVEVQKLYERFYKTRVG